MSDRDYQYPPDFSVLPNRLDQGSAKWPQAVRTPADAHRRPPSGERHQRNAGTQTLCQEPQADQLSPLAGEAGVPRMNNQSGLRPILDEFTDPARCLKNSAVIGDGTLAETANSVNGRPYRTRTNLHRTAPPKLTAPQLRHFGQRESSESFSSANSPGCFLDLTTNLPAAQRR